LEISELEKNYITTVTYDDSEIWYGKCLKNNPINLEEVLELKGLWNMVAYEFYWLHPNEGYQLIGVLPERRKNSARVTPESITRWGEDVFGKDFATKDIFHIKVTIDEKRVGIFRPAPFPIPKKDA
jgi:hypothetical protein